MKHEATLPNNPNELTINQHVFPRSAIQRFADVKGLVEVQRHAGNATFRVHPENGIFCAKRVWDHGTETFRSHSIEGAYAALADQLVSGYLMTLSPAMNDVVSEFYALWRARHAGRMDPLEDAKVNGCTAEQLTKEQEEAAEKKGAFFFRGDTLPSRMLTGFSMRRFMDQQLEQLKSARWGLVKAMECHYLVPDYPGDLNVVPVSPTLCLCSGVVDIEVGTEVVTQINRELLARATSYHFAQDLQQCPR